LSPETRAKISESNRGRSRKPFTAEHKAHISEAQQGKSLSAETRAKLAKANTGKKHSPETRAKISATLTGRQLSPEHRARISEAKSGKSGKSYTAEHKARISEGRKGKGKGRKLSPEHRDAIRQGMLRRYQRVEEQPTQIFPETEPVEKTAPVVLWGGVVKEQKDRLDAIKQQNALREQELRERYHDLFDTPRKPV
jgi:hypothetical protein